MVAHVALHLGDGQLNIEHKGILSSGPALTLSVRDRYAVSHTLPAYVRALVSTQMWIVVTVDLPRQADAAKGWTEPMASAVATVIREVQGAPSARVGFFPLTPKLGGVSGTEALALLKATRAGEALSSLREIRVSGESSVERDWKATTERVLFVKGFSQSAAMADGLIRYFQAMVPEDKRWWQFSDVYNIVDLLT